MASISTDRKTGLKRLVFTGLDGKRRTIYLGKVSDRTAQQIATCAEGLLDAALAGQAPSRQTTAILESLSPVMEQKLVQAELIFPRNSKERTLGEFLTAYLERRDQDVKGGTLVFYGHTVRNLTEFLGSDRKLDDITPGDADDFRRYLQQTEKLAAATVVRRCALSRTFFRDAVRRKLIDSNPFDGVGKGSTANPDRHRFINRATIATVIDVCPNAEWRLLVALSRFAGVRVPSEAVMLRWQDIDFPAGRILVHSPKTEHHAGKATRMVPIFPELRPYLEDIHELAPDGAEFVFDKLRRDAAKSETGWKAVNLRTQFTKIIRRVGIEPWPRLWHNLRSSRQTELTETFPAHVVSAWLGNSERVAEKHYLQVLDSHFAKAVDGPPTVKPETVETTRNPTRANSNPTHIEAHRELTRMTEPPEKQGVLVETACNAGCEDWAILDSIPMRMLCRKPLSDPSCMRPCMHTIPNWRA